MIYVYLGAGLLALIVALVTRSPKQRDTAIGAALLALLIALIFGGQW